jgi:hypothetical protein
MDNTGWSNSTTGAWSYYNNDVSNNAIYGKLYNWYTTLGDTLCPTGWGVPTDAEWTTLSNYLGGASVAGTLMKKNDALWTTNTGTNTSGFSGLPGGYRNYDGSFLGIRDFTFFWSDTEDETNTAWTRKLSYYDGDLNRYTGYPNYGKSTGAYVRCLRD